MSAFWSDLRYAARALARQPGFACVAILTLALGVGSTTAIFSIVNTVLLRPLTYRDPQALFCVFEVLPSLSHLYPAFPVNARHFQTWRERCSSFEQVALIRSGNVNLTGAGEPERLGAARVSANLFHLLGVEPQLGRSFLEEEDRPGRDEVAILTDSLWRRRFQADPQLPGKTILLDGKPHVVVGILPASFRFPKGDQLGALLPLDARTEVFRPAAIDPKEISLVGDYSYGAFARLRKGVTREQALAELNVVQSSIAGQMPEKLELRAALTPLQEQIAGPVRRGLLVLLGAISSVLLIVCVNLANLMLARGTARRRETAIRTALGASRWRLLWETLTSSLLLSLSGGALGVGFSIWGLHLLVRYAPVSLPRLDEVRLDGRVLAFGLFVSIVAGLLSGILPAWRAARTEPQEALKAGSRTLAEGRRGLRGLLVSLEVGLSTVLLIVAGLLMSSFVRLMRVDKGFAAEKLLAVDLVLPPTRFVDREQRDRFFERMLAGVRSVPGVVSADLVSALPLQGESWVDVITVQGDNRPVLERPLANFRFISPGYFRTMGIPLLQGRPLDERDRGRSVALVSERTAQRVWPGESAIGKRLVRGNPNEPPYEVIGVVRDVRVSLDKDPALMVYVPYWRRQSFRVSLVVRAAADPRSVRGGLSSAIWAADPEVAVPPPRTMEEVVDDAVAQRSFQMLLVALFAASALLLSSLGIYGVVSYSVARRTNEMGIRLALGASPAGLRRMILLQGLAPVWLGLAAGIGAALALGRLLRSLLFDISPTDPLTFAVVVLLLPAVAALACLLPAARATRLDPIQALRYE